MTSERLQEASEAAVEQEIGSWVAQRREHAIPTKDLQPHEFLSEECADCGEDLDLFRKQKGRTRCVECQTLLEKKKMM